MGIVYVEHRCPGLDVEERLDLITRGALEVVTVEELRSKLESGERLKGYIGYEPSGLVHIGWLIWMMKVRDLVEAGVDFTVLEATWHAKINDKLGGDLGLIREAARLVRTVMEALGLPVDRIRFLDAEELAGDKDYWALVIGVAKNASLARIKRALTIMGRRADEAEIDASKLIYPAMQVADIYYMDLDIALGGMDQRKAHMLARDIARKMGAKKPIAIHTPLLTGLQGAGRMSQATGMDIDEVYAEVKMSKSKPETTILVHEDPESIKRKLRAAYCPRGVEEHNPVIEINKYILFRQPGFKLVVERPQKYGGTVVYETYEDLARDFREGKLHPLDLKNATAEALARLLEPVRSRILGDKAILEAIERIQRSTSR